jgi:hypothetical protein
MRIRPQPPLHSLMGIRRSFVVNRIPVLWPGDRMRPPRGRRGRCSTAVAIKTHEASGSCGCVCHVLNTMGPGGEHGSRCAIFQVGGSRHQVSGRTRSRNLVLSAAETNGPRVARLLPFAVSSVST